MGLVVMICGLFPTEMVLGTDQEILAKLVGIKYR